MSPPSGSPHLLDARRLLWPMPVIRTQDRIKELVELVRAREKAIMEICVREARMSRKTFIKTFPVKILRSLRLDFFLSLFPLPILFLCSFW